MRRAVGQRKSERLDRTGHRVGGVHPAAGTRTRNRTGLDRFELGIRVLAVGMFAHRFKHRNDIEIFFLPLQRRATRQNRAAVNKHRRTVHTRHRHHAGRHVFVASADRHKAVHPFAADHRLDRVGNDLTRNKRVLHAFGTHRDAVGNRNGVEDYPLAARRVHTLA